MTTGKSTLSSNRIAIAYASLYVNIPSDNIVKAQVLFWYKGNFVLNIEGKAKIYPESIGSKWIITQEGRSGIVVPQSQIEILDELDRVVSTLSKGGSQYANSRH